jgi:hypothetical protein
MPTPLAVLTSDQLSAAVKELRFGCDGKWACCGNIGTSGPIAGSLGTGFVKGRAGARRCARAAEEASMSLVFGPDHVAYDPTQQALRFFARDDFRLVYCAISRAALAALEDDALGGIYAMATTYRRHKGRIRGLALRKYLDRRYENGVIVIVRKEDLLP